MKKAVSLFTIGTLYGLTASPAFAAMGILENKCCLIFLFFGALVVIAQMIPAVLIILGFIRGFPIKHPDQGEGGVIGKNRG
jgi:uncharacterized membrane protein SpoIIM required for sporulation